MFGITAKARHAAFDVGIKALAFGERLRRGEDGFGGFGRDLASRFR